MALTQELSFEFPGAAVAGERAERALRLPMGVVSPLWTVFAAAAGVGVAYWWMTSWTRAVNVEAMSPFGSGLRDLSRAVAGTAVMPELVEIATEAEAVSPPEAADAAPAPLVAADDLTRMTGIGPKLSAALAELGVTRFAQIAAWTGDDLAAMDAELSLKGRAVREAWVAQAKRLAKGE
jgi:predicted flap endonuclease-1-like 5' DNA nuclease